MNVAMLPHVNASLNATSGVLLLAGFYCIRRRWISAHRACMVAAFSVTMAFFASYLTYHAHVGSITFKGIGPSRTLYFAILISHTILAITIVPLAVRTLYLAGRQRFESHRALARWTLPLWLYVSVTGVIVYWMLYHYSP